jgi:hypothetical protein
MDETSYRSVVGYGHGDTRADFLYALDEVMKGVVASTRWGGFLGKEEGSADPSEPAAAAAAQTTARDKEEVSKRHVERKLRPRAGNQAYRSWLSARRAPR